MPGLPNMFLYINYWNHSRVIPVISWQRMEQRIRQSIGLIGNSTRKPGFDFWPINVRGFPADFPLNHGIKRRRASETPCAQHSVSLWLCYLVVHPNRKWVSSPQFSRVSRGNVQWTKWDNSYLIYNSWDEAPSIMVIICHVNPRCINPGWWI